MSDLPNKAVTNKAAGFCHGYPRLGELIDVGTTFR
jgi:hypothetical protein